MSKKIKFGTSFFCLLPYQNNLFANVINFLFGFEIPLSFFVFCFLSFDKPRTSYASLRMYGVMQISSSRRICLDHVFRCL